jgi:opacity protein-like surface antigen
MKRLMTVAVLAALLSAAGSFAQSSPARAWGYGYGYYGYAGCGWRYSRCCRGYGYYGYYPRYYRSYYPRAYGYYGYNPGYAGYRPFWGPRRWWW